MTNKPLYMSLLLVLVIAGCNSADQETVRKDVTSSSAAAKVNNELPVRSPGKPGAPITIAYKVLGTPVVGQPVAVEVQVSSSLSDAPVRVSYFVNDVESMRFPESQSRTIELSAPADDGFAARQVTVIPLREGRLYLNVTAEVETSAGRMLKTMAVPIAVGQGVAEPVINGELRETADGETVISMPAREN
ncbi:MAG: hypothetical protein RIA65_01090 [Woeseia sp.]